jgi:two-component system, response regulator RegA
MRILFVDDHEVMRLSLCALLEDLGHQVTEAASLAEARAHLAQGAAFEVALIDYTLRDGKGTELVPDIRRRIPAAKVVLLSGTAAWELGKVDADLLLEKGMDPEEMMTRIGNLAPK